MVEASTQTDSETIDQENQIGLNYLIRNRYSTEFITNALNENSIRLNYRNNDGDTALHLAVEVCNENIVDLLVRKGARVDIKNNLNKTPIDIMHEICKNSSNSNDSDRAKWKAIQISLEGESSSNEWMELDENPAKRPASPLDNSTSEPKKRKTHHPAGGIKTSLHGIVFQLKLLMLFACHAIERSSGPFLMASEMVAAEKFDDIVFHMNHKTRYLQAKHKLDCEKDKITSASLLSTSNKEAFSLQKYFISFCKIKRNEEWFGKSDLCEFIIITNTYPDLTETGRTIKHRDSNASIKWRKICKKELSDDDREILYIDKFGAEKYKLDVTGDLREIMIMSLLNDVLGMKLIENLVAIRDTLKAIKTVQFKASIIEAKRSVEKINEKSSKDHIKLKCDKVLQLEGKVFDEKTNKNYMDSLKKAKREFGKSLKNRKSGLNELKREFLDKAQEISELAMKELKDSETLLAKSKDSKSNEFKMLEEDKQKMLEAEKELNEARKKIQKAKNLESLKQQSKNSIIKNYVSLKFFDDDDLRKVDSKDKLEEVKSKMDGKLEQIISQISIIHVWFNEFDSLFNEFFQKLYFVTNYPDNKKLDEYINDELRESFNLLNSDLLMAALEEKMLNFLKYYENGRAKFLTLDDIKTFFDTLKKKLTGIMASGLHTLHVNVLKNYGIRFKKNPEKLQAFFNEYNDQMQVFHFCTTTSRLSAIKVLRTIEACPLFRQPDSYIFTNLHTLLVGEVGSTYTLMQPQEIILNAFRAPKSHFLLVIECHDEADGENEKRLDLNKLYESLFDILSENPKKKLILIAKSELLFGRLKINHFQEDKIVFKDLEDASQTRVLRKNVNFQKKNNIELIALIDENSANSVFDQMILEEFIESDKKPFKIGDDKAFLSIDYVINFYINRQFLRNGTTQAEEDFCKGESFKNKVIIVANEAGMGKSTVLTSIAEKMKNTLSNLWIVRVNLNDYADRRKPQSLFKIHFDENDVNSAINFLTKMVIVSYPKKNPANRFQQNLFKLGLENNHSHDGTVGRKPKIVIIFDGFDEVSRNLKTRVTVLIKALKMSQVTQIWVSTRLHKKSHLEKALESKAYELDPLSELDQIELASKFWKWKLKFAKTLSEKKHVLKSFKEILEYLLDIKLPETDYATQLRESILEIRRKFPLKNRSKKKALIEDIDSLDFSEYIKKLKDHWESVEDKDFHFTENPLHLRMLTEVIYEKKFELLENFGLFDLFDAFVEIKFGIYYKNKGNARGNETIEELCNRDTDNLRKIHCALAVKKLTNNNYQYATLPNLQFECKDKQQFDRIGFLKLDEEKDTLEFIHRSYAEFFCSIYLIDNQENEQVQKLAKNLVPNQDSSKEDDYKLLRQFIMKNTNKNELKKNVFFQ